jgi:hypothetical protein
MNNLQILVWSLNYGSSYRDKNADYLTWYLAACQAMQ